MLVLASAIIAAPAAPAIAQSPPPANATARLNPVIELLEQRQAVFGLYAPANPRVRPGAEPSATQASAKTPVQLGRDALAYTRADYIFDGSMEGNFERGYATFVELARGMFDGGMLRAAPTRRLTHPLFVKTPEIAADPDRARARIAQQLNLGVSGIVFVDVQSADEVRQGLAMMRFASKGGTRPDAVDGAPARWGMGEQEYRERADLWPLNPRGELVNFAIVESREGLAKVREIAAVPGIGVLFPGAGTLRGIFSTADSTGRRVLDQAAWEGAIQQVLAACREFDVPCGYPAGEADIEMRMKQGFRVFIIGWGDAGFRAVDAGRRTAGRD
ncbi:MAG: aldolase/citrate lyase family protein [Gemmatimonadaceae bacterium]